MAAQDQCPSKPLYDGSLGRPVSVFSYAAVDYADTRPSIVRSDRAGAFTNLCTVYCGFNPCFEKPMSSSTQMPSPPFRYGATTACSALMMRRCPTASHAADAGTRGDAVPLRAARFAAFRRTVRFMSKPCMYCTLQWRVSIQPNSGANGA